jgi:hypothetical protein
VSGVGEESESRIAELLKASDIAASASQIARGVKDFRAAGELKAKSERLYAEALAIDPAQNADAWSE